MLSSVTNTIIVNNIKFSPHIQFERCTNILFQLKIKILFRGYKTGGSIFIPALSPKTINLNTFCFMKYISSLSKTHTRIATAHQTVSQHWIYNTSITDHYKPSLDIYSYLQLKINWPQLIYLVPDFRRCFLSLRPNWWGCSYLKHLSSSMTAAWWLFTAICSTN